jgi:hypothetical protein
LARAEIRRAIPEDVEAIAGDPRAADVAELWACGRVTPAQALAFGFRHGGEYTWTGVVDGQPVCMFGVTPVSLLGRSGTPWMVGTRRLDRHALSLIRHSHEAVRLMRSAYDSMANVVDARNTAAIRWLRWIGFTVEDKTTIYGPDRLPFHRFTMGQAP